MEGGGGSGAAVSPVASGGRRHKVLTPWRFQSGFERREAIPGFVSDGNRCVLETLQMNCQTATGDGRSASLNDGSGVDGESPASDVENEVPKNRGGGAVDGGDRGSGGVDGNPAAKKGDSLPKDGEIPEDLAENDRVTADPHVTAKPCDLPGSQNNGPTEEINLAVNNSEGFMTSEDTVPGCRKGRKAVAPWRFQTVNKPKWAQGLSSGNRSNGEIEGPTSKDGDGSRKHAPAVVPNHSHLKGSATRGRSKVRSPKGTGSAPKKRKVDKDGQYEAMPNNRISVVRENVLSTLRQFRIIYPKLLEEEQINGSESGHDLSPDLAAFNIFRKRFCVNYDDLKYDGSIPGVRVGDVFNSVMELYIVGIHRAQSLPVDHIKKKDGTCLAVSVVSYAQPSVSDNLDVLLHVGSVTDTSDQEMEGTDLALNESMETYTPVRVIHAVVTELGDDCQPKQLTSYVYGGLYLVEKFHREKTSGSQYVSTFHLRRMPEQKHIDLQVLRTKTLESFAGTFNVDISGGLEKLPISAINSISNEYLTTFHYISQIQYPLKYRPDPPSGCDCVGGCSASQKCACAVKNGGGFHFNDIGGLMEGKPLIYECGPLCKCPPTCHNRVSQHGIKFRLQVFKTKSMGWGVRTLDFIPEGSFVCEYIGEILEDEEAQKRKNDEYLFAIGNNYYDVPYWKSESKDIPSLQNGPSEDDETVFAVDALNQGNFARFINHCCTPNLFPQNILHDHDNISMPHITFFASEDIPPLKELSYDYNYQIDKVYDSDGNIKMKPCFCGSSECTRRLY